MKNAALKALAGTGPAAVPAAAVGMNQHATFPHEQKCSAIKPSEPFSPELQVCWLNVRSLCEDLSCSYLRCKMLQNIF